MLRTTDIVSLLILVVDCCIVYCLLRSVDDDDDDDDDDDNAVSAFCVVVYARFIVIENRESDGVREILPRRILRGLYRRMYQGYAISTTDRCAMMETVGFGGWTRSNLVFPFPTVEKIHVFFQSLHTS
jgi:hypothetical protein